MERNQENDNERDEYRATHGRQRAGHHGERPEPSHPGKITLESPPEGRTIRL